MEDCLFNSSGLLKLVNDKLAAAVEKKYLQSEAQRKFVHEELANYLYLFCKID